MKHWRVLVCGSNYGRSYIEAVRAAGPDYVCAGLLARGSERSRRVAQRAGTELFQHTRDLPAGLDLACFALPAASARVALKLLSRGIAVLCEHPQPPDFLRSALETAAQHGTRFHLNAHFADVDACRAFLLHARLLGETERPRFIHATVTHRSLYAALDVLGRALGAVEPCEITSASGAGFCTLAGRLSGIPAVFTIQNAAGQRAQLRDGSPGYVVDMQLAAAYGSGVLSLLSIAGPVVWNWNVAAAHADTAPLGRILHPASESGRHLRQERIQANAWALQALAEDVTGERTPVCQTPSHILSVSRGWHSLAEAMRPRPQLLR